MNLSRSLRRVARPVPGQSLVFSAILIFVLIGFAALAIDTGEAFSRQRQQQAASNAASIAGLEAMDKTVDGTDPGVQSAIQRALAANGITNPIYINGNWGNLDPTQNYYRAFYTQRGSRAEYPIGSGGQISTEFTGIRVEVRSARDTVFAQTLGVDTLEVSAEGQATLCQCATNIFPIAISTQKVAGATYGKDLYVDVTKTKVTSANEVHAAVWAEWRDRSGVAVDTRVAESLGGTGDYILGYAETTPPPGFSNTSANGVLNNDDWTKVSDSTANTSNTAIKNQLNKLIGKRILVPTFNKLAYAGTTGTEKYTSFRSSGFVEIQITSFSGSRINFKYISSNSLCPCVDIPDLPPPPEIQLTLDQKLVWYLPSVNTTSYDISLVIDISGSMKSCWDSPTGTGTCSIEANARWSRMKTFLRKFSYKMLDVWNAPAGQNMNNASLFPGEILTGQGGDNRIAAVRFSGNADTSSPSFGFVTTPTGTSDSAIAGRTATMKTNMANLINWVTRDNMNGSTSGGRGLREGIRYFDNATAHTRVDKNGRPIKLVMLMLTDGLTNVMYEGPQQNAQNTQTLKHTRSGGSRYCKSPSDPTAGNISTPGGSGYPITDNPEVQATCPWDGQGAGSGYAKAPIVSMVEVATAARNRVSPLRPVNIYAILMGNAGLYDEKDLRIDQVASPGGAFYASSPNALDQALDTIIDDLAQPCYERDATILASAARVDVYDAAGNPVAGAGNMRTSTSGQLLFTVPEPGNYSFAASRSVTSWSEFPLGNGETINQSLYPANYLPQLYNRLRAPEDTVPQNRISFNVPEDAEGLINLGKFTLIISQDQASKALCPE